MFHAHLNTIIPNKLRKVSRVIYERVRIFTPDGDFLDLDRAFNLEETAKTVVLIHGLEGSSQSGYMKGMTQTLLENGFNVCALNLRGCSGEDNLMLQTYHSGKIDDLHTVLRYLHQKEEEIVLAVGYSLGANLLLRYAGGPEYDNPMPKAVVAVSAPVDLAGSSRTLNGFHNRIYLWHFLRKLKKKARLKLKKFPEANLNLEKVLSSRNFYEFDDAFTAPVNGYAGAADYYEKASALPHLKHISVPTLLLNALDDNFLSKTCYPDPDDVGNPLFHALYPEFGGHVGFIDRFPLSATQWHERQIMSFAKSF